MILKKDLMLHILSVLTHYLMHYDHIQDHKTMDLFN